MSLTDGTYICALCGQWCSACSLCVNPPMKKVTNDRRSIFYSGTHDVPDVQSHGDHRDMHRIRSSKD